MPTSTTSPSSFHNLMAEFDTLIHTVVHTPPAAAVNSDNNNNNNNNNPNSASQHRRTGEISPTTRSLFPPPHLLLSSRQHLQQQQQQQQLHRMSPEVEERGESVLDVDMAAEIHSTLHGMESAGGENDLLRQVELLMMGAEAQQHNGNGEEEGGVDDFIFALNVLADLDVMATTSSSSSENNQQPQQRQQEDYDDDDDSGALNIDVIAELEALASVAEQKIDVSSVMELLQQGSKEHTNNKQPTSPDLFHILSPTSVASQASSSIDVIADGDDGRMEIDILAELEALGRDNDANNDDDDDDKVVIDVVAELAALSGGDSRQAQVAPVGAAHNHDLERRRAELAAALGGGRSTVF